MPACQLLTPWKQGIGVSVMSFPALLATLRAEGSAQYTSARHRYLLTNVGRGPTLVEEKPPVGAVDHGEVSLLKRQTMAG